MPVQNVDHGTTFDSKGNRTLMLLATGSPFHECHKIVVIGYNVDYAVFNGGVYSSD